MICVICKADYDTVMTRISGGNEEACCGVCVKALNDARKSVSQYMSYYGNNREAAKCSVCGGDTKIARSTGRPMKYCSAKCRIASTRKVAEQKECVVCGGCFISSHSGKICCSPECSLERRKQQALKSVREDGGCHRRRSIRFDVSYEVIDPLEIFRRDKWICQLCLSPVNQDVAFPHPLSATLDHITPMSKGGPHTRDNVQCSHWCCNSAKRDGKGAMEHARG